MQIKDILRLNLIVSAIIGGGLYFYTVILVTGDVDYYRPGIGGKFGYPIVHGFIIFYALLLPAVLRKKETLFRWLVFYVGLLPFMNSYIAHDPLEGGVLGMLRIYFGASHLAYPLYMLAHDFNRKRQRFR